jgi:5-methylcytosine-specific restriction endonuclease McrA
MMAYSDEMLSDIYDRTAGYCHICGKKLAFKNYAAPGAQGAWEIEHSVPRANGGTERRNNLYAACIPCNREKRDGSTRAARARHGRTRAPLSREKRAAARRRKAVAGGAAGAVIGGRFFGPAGALIGGLIGAAIGDSAKAE